MNSYSDYSSPTYSTSSYQPVDNLSSSSPSIDDLFTSKQDLNLPSSNVGQDAVVSYSSSSQKSHLMSYVLLALATIVVISLIVFLIHKLFLSKESHEKPIEVNCPECPTCPSCPQCPKIPSCPEIPPCPETSVMPTPGEIVNTIFPGRGAYMADGSYASVESEKYEDGPINKGTTILDRPVNTIDSKYVVDQQSIEMERVKQKLRQIGDEHTTPPLQNGASPPPTSKPNSNL